MTQKERTQKSRELILNIAMKEFAVCGYHHASINRICDAGNISKGRMFHHFKNKDDIYVSAVDFAFDSLLSHLQGFEPHGERTVENIVYEYFRYRQTYFHDNAYQTMFIKYSIFCTPEHLQDRLLAARNRLVSGDAAVLEAVLSDAVPMQDENQKKILAQVYSIAANYVNLARGGVKFKPEENMDELFDENVTLFNAIIKVMLYGVIPRE